VLKLTLTSLSWVTESMSGWIFPTVVSKDLREILDPKDLLVPPEIPDLRV